MKKLITLIALVGIGIFASQCGDDDSGTTNPPMLNCTTNITYTNGAKVVLDANCSVPNCHDATTVRAGRDFSSYDEASANAAQSVFLCAINHDSGCTPMPFQGAKLSDSDIQILACWVQQGLQE